MICHRGGPTDPDVGLVELKEGGCDTADLIFDPTLLKDMTRLVIQD